MFCNTQRRGAGATRYSLGLFLDVLGGSDVVNLNPYTGAVNFSANGAASAPALLLSGTPFAGTGITSFPLLYLNDGAATASTTLNTAGTYFGVNGHGTADLANLMLDGVSKFRVSSAGILSLAGGSAAAVAINGGTANSGIWFDGGIVLTRSGVNAVYIDQVQGVLVKSTLPVAWASGDPDLTGGDLKLFRLAAASLQLGSAASASPTANTFTIGESSRSGTDSNVAGASGILQPGRGTGTGATTPLILNAPVQVASGTGAQTQTEFMRGQAVGTAIGIGFLGAAASARILMATGAAHTVDDLIAAFQTYGLFRQS